MSALPPTCEIGLKEWAGVCEALEDGRQTLILRKGGISEGPGGFVPEHRHFWLYPTYLHEAEQGLRLEQREKPSSGPRPAPDDPVSIQALAEVELIRHVESLEQLDLLEPFHVWRSETVRKRFEYRRPGLWVLGVRVYRGDRPWTVDPTPEQLGCKSWVTLDPPRSTDGLRPVLSSTVAWARLEELRSLLPPGHGAP